MAERLKKGTGIFLLIIAVILLTVLTGWVGMTDPDKMAALTDWVAKTKSLWLVWRGGLYVALSWSGWKIWQVAKRKPEYRGPLRRIMVTSLLFILLCEYALSGNIEGVA
ncbi:hypothetical protein [Xenorhabdus bovienii]|uniref:Putative exported protein n=1 Tax=Xenorhabdus bovienii TaxID=40576 RepID=A0A0B6X4W0_XENBV|nr:hypothetical protein [Xenorhabdus bovienii]CDM88615.1 putative exported protein [Xenorhabdus bovienii]